MRNPKEAFKLAFQFARLQNRRKYLQHWIEYQWCVFYIGHLEVGEETIRAAERVVANATMTKEFGISTTIGGISYSRNERALVTRRPDDRAVPVLMYATNRFDPAEWEVDYSPVRPANVFEQEVAEAGELWQELNSQIKPKIGREFVEAKRWVRKLSFSLPSYVAEVVRTNWHRQALKSVTNANRTATNAVNYLKRAGCLEKLNKRIREMPLTVEDVYGNHSLKPMAAEKANFAFELIQDLEPVDDDAYVDSLIEVYHRLFRYTKEQGVKPCELPEKLPEDRAAELIETACAKMMCDKWWHRRLAVAKDQCFEYLNTAMGLVGNLSPYCSVGTLSKYRQKQADTLAWIQKMEVESEDGITLDMLEVVKSSMANPENRRIELIVRARGMEETAADVGHECWFLTMTCPSKYHRTSKKWDASTAIDGQKYLAKVFTRIRAKLARDDIEYTGVRVAEAHKDGTPHWHLAVWVHPEQAKELRKIFRGYCLQEDGKEPGAWRRRFTAKRINPEQGSAVGYLIKYLSKNINAAFMKEFKEEDTPTAHDKNPDKGRKQVGTEEGAERVVAWATTYRVRQFQTFGAPPVTAWRELRRLKQPLKNPLFEKVRQAADNSRWGEFMQLAKVVKVETETEVTPQATDYNEDSKKIVGVKLGGIFIPTRNTRWVLKKRGSASPWSTGNNCTSPLVEELKQHSAVHGFDFDDIDIENLLAGRRIRAAGERRGYQLQGNQLRECY